MQHHIKIEDIMAAVEVQFGLKPREFRDDPGSIKIASTEPRRMVAYLARQHCGATIGELSARLGRDEKSIRNAIAQVNRSKRYQPDLQSKLETVWACAAEMAARRTRRAVEARIGSGAGNAPDLKLLAAQARSYAQRGVRPSSIARFLGVPVDVVPDLLR